MHPFTLLFLFSLAVWVSLSIWLSVRHQRHIALHRHKVPPAFADKVSIGEHRKAADYSIARTRFGRIELLAGALILLLMTLGGLIDRIDAVWRAAQWPELATGGAVILSVLLISALLDIPSALYRTFVIEERFGFNKSTMTTFWVDRLKGLFLVTLLGVPLLLLILWLMQIAGGLWWLYAWAALSVFSLSISWAFPKFIAPLFNRFEALEEGEVADRLQSLLERTGFRSDGIFVMDGSRRSSHGNAYFTGFGKSKRIVFFDTLLEQLTPAQVEAVLAHELGHFKRRHIIKGMAISLAMTFCGFVLLAWLMQQAWFFEGLGVSTMSSYMALLLFVLVSPVFTFLIGPAMAWFSRRHEFEADAFAAEQSDARDLITALVNLYRENASTLTPDPLHSAFHDSHPPASIRIARLEELALQK
jgi:STE24 endopeptidase